MKTLLIGLLLALELASTRPAVAAPTTRPDSPQSFQQIYNASLKAKDAAALRELFVADTPGEKAVVDAYIKIDLAVDRLASQIAETFATPMTGGSRLIPPDGRGTWRVEDNTARLMDDVAKHRFPLVMSSGGYKLDLWRGGLSWANNADAKETLQRVDVSPQMDDLTEQVRAGKFRSAGDALYTVQGVEGTPLAPIRRAAGQPTTGPTTRPVTVDLSTPQAAYQTLGNAMHEGDATALLACIEIIDPRDTAAWQAQARWVAAMGRLWSAASTRFGVDFADQVTRFTPMPTPLDLSRELLACIQREKFVERGDEVTVHYISVGGQELVRVGGKWKVRSRPKAEVGAAKDPNAMDGTALLTAVAEAAERYARRIESGEFKTSDDLIKAIAAEQYPSANLQSNPSAPPAR